MLFLKHSLYKKIFKKNVRLSIQLEITPTKEQE